MLIQAQIVTAVMILFSLVPGLAQASNGQTPEIKRSEKLLFSSFSPLNVRIEAPFNELISKKDDFAAVKKIRVPGKMYIDQKTIPIEVRLRGFSSLYFCSFPKFTLYIDKAAASGTPFEDIKKVDVGTHCDPKRDENMIDTGAVPIFKMMKYNHREALLYKWLQILNIPGYASRPAHLIYIDTSIPDSLEVREQAFFLEHLDAFLKRADGIEIRTARDESAAGEPHQSKEKEIDYKPLYTNLESHPEIDRQQLARISFFNAFIGNSDFRLNPKEIWNLKLIELKNGSWFPIPLDFNLAEVTLGSVELPMFFNDMYSFANKSLQMQIVKEYLEKMPELNRSLSTLYSDPEGFQNFQALLKKRQLELETMKKHIPLMEKKNEKK